MAQGCQCDQARIRTARTDLSFEFCQSFVELTALGTYTVTVRVCTNEPLGTGYSCQEVPGGAGCHD